MRIKNFTLMLMAVLFSAVGFAQKSFTADRNIAFNRQTEVQTLTVKSLPMAAAAASQQTAPSAGRAKARAKAPEVVTPPEKGIVEYYTMTGTYSAQNNSGTETRQVKVVWDEEDEDVVYISGLSYYMPKAFVRGTFNKEGDKVTFEKGQYMGYGYGVDFYFGAYNEKEGFIDAVADFNEKESSFTFNDALLDNYDPKDFGYYAMWLAGVTIVPLENPEIPVEVPRDMEVETYAFTAVDYFEDDTEVSGNVNVGFYGDDVYIQGFSNDYPEAWVKGTFTNDSTVVFASGQLLTEEEALYFVAITPDFDVTDEYSMIYEKETGTFYEGPNAFLINSYKDKIDRSVWQFYYNYEIKLITEQAATPAKSVISNIQYKTDGDWLEYNLAKVDVDGNGLVAEKLNFSLWYVSEQGDTLQATFSPDEYVSLKEELTEVPASISETTGWASNLLPIYMEGHETWKAVGIQGIYYGGEERHESEITWHNPTWPITISKPEGEMKEHLFTGYTYDSDSGSGVPFERNIGIVFSEDGNQMFIHGLGEANSDTWVVGEKDSNGNFVFRKGQTLGNYGDTYRLFLVGWANETAGDVVLIQDPANGVYEFPDAFLENASYTDRSYYLNNFMAGATITIAEAGEIVYTPVEVPADLETEVWSFSATDPVNGTPYASNVNVGFDGDDVYVQGISSTFPNAWVKGTVDGDQVVFASGQFLGVSDEDNVFFIGFNYDSWVVHDYVMDYDPETFTMTCPIADEWIGINTIKTKVDRSMIEYYNNVKIKKLVEKVATPATPVINNLYYSVYGPIAKFTVPAVDVEGDGLVDSLMSYKLYYDEGDGEAKEVVFTTDLYKYLAEDKTVIPYGFIDSVDDDGNPAEYDFGASEVFLNMDMSTWQRIGIQTIYTGGGETTASEIGWYTPTWPFTVELPEDAQVATYTFTGIANGSRLDENSEFTKAVNVAMVGDSLVYIQGVGRESETAWIVGKKNSDDTSYTFANGQRLGVLDLNGEYDYLFLMGYNDTFGPMNVKMTYDPETGIFTTTTDLAENADYTDRLYYWTRISAGAQIKPLEEVAATPAVPSIEHMAYTYYGNIAEFSIPTVDVDGNPIIPNLLSYKLYYDEGDGEAKEVVFTTDLYECLEEDMTVIPYGFLDDVDEEGNPAEYDFGTDEVYLNMDQSTWVRVGIQAIYTAAGETNASEIGWYTPTYPFTVELPEGAEVASYGFVGSYTDEDETTTDFSKEVKVAKVGDDVYVQGVANDYEYWIKGTKQEGTNNYTFSAGQFVGGIRFNNSIYLLFITGYDDIDGVMDLEMSYDEETGIFTTVTAMLENATYTDKMYYLNWIAAGAQLIPAENPDAISAVKAEIEEGTARYNVAGQRVGKSYKGLVVTKDGKFLQK